MKHYCRQILRRWWNSNWAISNPKDDAVKVFHSIWANLENSAVARGLEKVSFISIPKKSNAKECSNYHTTALISHASKAVLKILQARLQQHVNQELPDVQAGFREGRGTRNQIANICWIREKTSKLQKNTYCFTDYLEASDCVDHKKWKILKELGILDNLTFPLRNLGMGQEATVRTGHGTTDWFQTGKGVHQGHIMSYCVFNFYAEHIVWNTRLESRLPGEIPTTSADMQMIPL